MYGHRLEKGTTMGKAIRRRAVYAGTILAILIMATGFVVATVLSGITITQTGQNAGSITGPTNTIFATTSPVTLTVTLVQATAPASSCGADATWLSSATTANVYISGTAACTTNPGDWFEELTWSNVPSTGDGQYDMFYITTTFAGGSGSNSATFTVSDVASIDAPFTGTLHVYLDAGPSSGGALPNAYTGIDIAVSGT
jgi:hypothetical protein